MLQMIVTEVPRRLEAVRPDTFITGLVERPAGAPGGGRRTTRLERSEPARP